ncbi:MAG: FliA/WhiG family RNA polymerase sigma factor [Deferribacteraceae bacterium]|jgi:RNA polymerase sigma factor for flagellar operon FliA|nr:FliA/WhiG family RNA polymerase sigma factor [Deferribacteraceae bacterium]
MTYSVSTAVVLTEDEKDQIVRDYLPKIKSWAQRARWGLPDSVDIDELYSAAALGLIECLGKYDKTRDASFATYVEYRVKGAILDALRGMDFLSRSARARVKVLEHATDELSAKLGRTPTMDELSEYTELSHEKLEQARTLHNTDKVVSLNAVQGEEGLTLADIVQSPMDSPEDEIIKQRRADKIAQEIDALPEKERLMVSLYYYEELTMKEVAAALGVSESRVSQIHTHAIKKLKKRLKDVI